MKMPEKQRMIKYYEDLFDKYDYDYRSLDWKDPEGQKIRYSVLFSIIEMAQSKAGFSLADIGCGLGHLYGYLKDRKLLNKHKIKYSGFDISSKLVEAAKKKYPEGKFEVKDILDGYFTERFDFVFSCGVFNIKFTTEDEHQAFVKEMILRMYEASKIGAAINFLSYNGISYVSEKGIDRDSVYYYFKPEDIIRFVSSFTGRYILRHDYHVGDFTLYLFKER